ncbi:caspase family protein [Sphingomonadaceae bacterium G21617-S1]|nr:caspase family protein [Sphingomonadaceae bacterium G21617-S1]
MRLFLALLGLAALPMEPAAAMVRAVLVGASTFSDPTLGAYALPGAATDARRMADALAMLGADRDAMTLLTGEAATLPAIRAALDRLATTSGAGDRAVIFLSGHGTQAPASRGDPLEPDGRDELFLAADAGPWDERSKTVPGALIDDEIGRRIGELRARGTDVWVIIDSCTGGSLLRGSAGTPKTLAPERLGIPATAPLRGAVDGSGFVDGGLAGGGRLVAFAAAGPGAIAWDDGDGGAFTRALAGAIAQHAPASFAALAAAVDARPPGGTSAGFWTAGELSAPVLFDGRSPDMIDLARALPPLPFATTLSVDRAGACRAAPAAPPRPAKAGDGATLLRHCDHVRVDMGEAGSPLRVEAWYRDAAGGYTSLAPPLGLIVAAGRWANVGFTFVTHDPGTGRALPRGEEYLVLIARDSGGAAIGATLLAFRAAT